MGLSIYFACGLIIAGIISVCAEKNCEAKCGDLKTEVYGTIKGFYREMGAGADAALQACLLDRRPHVNAYANCLIGALAPGCEKDPGCHAFFSGKIGATSLKNLPFQSSRPSESIWDCVSAKIKDEKIEKGGLMLAHVWIRGLQSVARRNSHIIPKMNQCLIANGAYKAPENVHDDFFKGFFGYIEDA